MAAALFITYDGLLDPLGSSQILPYLYSIARHPRPLHILSFEKPERFAAGAETLRAELALRSIGWTPLSFTTRFGKLGKGWDLLRMYGTAIGLQLSHRFAVIHCRSYQAMQVGCLLHRMAGVQTIFDMRGLWVDERVDGGLWRPGRWLDRLAYRAYKNIERGLLACATHVIALTERVVPELRQLSQGMTAPVTVIPCCADFDHFRLPAPAERQAMRAELGIQPDAKVICYLGSLGTWYMLEDMLHFFAAAASRWGEAHLLLITRDWREEHEALVDSMGLKGLRGFIHVRPATRYEVPGLLGASDVMLSFIKPAYSKMASSPTKLAEAFAMGVPVISNSGIGDVDQMTRDLDAGAVFDLSDRTAMLRVADDLTVICSKGGQQLRDRARKILGLEVAEATYCGVYESLETGR